MFQETEWYERYKKKVLFYTVHRIVIVCSLMSTVLRTVLYSTPLRQEVEEEHLLTNSKLALQNCIQMKSSLHAFNDFQAVARETCLTLLLHGGNAEVIKLA